MPICQLGSKGYEDGCIAEGSSVFLPNEHVKIAKRKRRLKMNMLKS